MLATIGRFAYVAPALALLAQPKFAHAGYGRGGGDGGGISFGGGSTSGGAGGGTSGGSSGGVVTNIGRRRHWGVQGPQAPSQRRRSSWKFW